MKDLVKIFQTSDTLSSVYSDDPPVTFTQEAKITQLLSLRDDVYG